MKRATRLTLGLTAIAVLSLAAIGTYFWFAPCEGIVDYSPSRDRAFILQIFKENWDWLISSPDYSVEHMLDTRSSSKDLENIGNLTIKVYCEAGNPKAFTAYYKKAFYKGQVLFVATPESERRKGYAEKLLRYAIEDLKKKGSTVIQLVTRVTNERAQNLYKKIGFTEIWRDEGFVRFELLV